MPASSPLFFQSSPAPEGDADGQVSSPLRQMSNSQSTESQNAAPPPSSPLQQMSDTQEMSDGNRTPRASGMIGGT